MLETVIYVVAVLVLILRMITSVIFIITGIAFIVDATEYEAIIKGEVKYAIGICPKCGKKHYKKYYLAKPRPCHCEGYDGRGRHCEGIVRFKKRK